MRHAHNLFEIDPYFIKAIDISARAMRAQNNARPKGGGGGGSNKEYERQLREQRLATEAAEREAAALKKEQQAVQQRTKDRQKASLLTSDDGLGDPTVTARRTLLGSGT